MSAKVIGQVWEKALPFNKAWVLMAYADHADHDGRNVYPRLGLIAWKTGYSLPNVKRIVADLRKDGILVPDGHTKGGVVRYRIVLDHVEDKPKYVEADAGRPDGASDKQPRGPREKNPYQIKGYQIDTTLFDTHNRHSTFNKKSNGTDGTNNNYNSDLDDSEWDGLFGSNGGES